MTPPDTSREIMSRAALDPRQSVVVEACAGSGKTWLLVSRILRLLLAGAPPSSILAITFTRKAAHEMKQRLTQYLETLATASPDAARRFLRERYMADADIEAILPRLPGLPAAVAFASPGLNIATFHGWYQQLLTAAPLGMGSGDATIADSEYTLLQEAWLLLAEELSHQPASPAAQALDRLYAEKGLTNTQKILFTFIARRAEWLAYAKNLAGDSDPVAAALAQMAADWGLQPDSDPLAEWHTNPAHHEALQQLIRGLAGVPKLTEPMNKWLLQLEAAIIETSPEERHTTLTTLCLTQKGEMRQHPKNWADKAGQAETFTHLCVGLLRVAQTQRDQETWRYNRDALIAANALLATYEKLKTHQRVLDFTDLEWRAYQLITDSEHADTVQYRLDNRYRHILLDEFQDTNPIQWQCLVAWLDASRSAHDGADQTPTVFMVGDPKQAIYRFRRTDARLFDQARDYFIKHFNASAYSLNHAWRNAPAVLNFINPLFAAQPAFTGFVPHQAERQSWGGVCVLPPFEGKATAAAIEVPAETQAAAAWRNPLTQAREEEDSDRFEAEAAHMAQTIQQMVGRLIIDAPDSTQPRDLPRPARYGDILVLFRARTHLAAFENALKRAGIPYTGARPGGLIDALEVQDLIALLTFLATPDDDLALAQVLKSPLFAVSDQDLLTLRFAITHAGEEGGEGEVGAAEGAAEGAPLGRAEPAPPSWWQRLQAMCLDKPQPPLSAPPFPKGGEGEIFSRHHLGTADLFRSVRPRLTAAGAGSEPVEGHSNLLKNMKFIPFMVRQAHHERNKSAPPLVTIENPPQSPFRKGGGLPFENNALTSSPSAPPTLPSLALQRAAHRLTNWLQDVDRLPVHDLLDCIYHQADVMQAYEQALPQALRAAARANLQTFMALTLEMDSGRYPSLPRFLTELKQFRKLPDQEAPDAGAVLGEEDSGINAVRLMTIHAAKGLESPIVWLIDAARENNRSPTHTVLVDWPPREPAPRHFSLVADKSLRTQGQQQLIDEEAHYQTREGLNLLYVALTRARQYLIISGTLAGKPGGPRENPADDSQDHPSPAATGWLAEAMAVAKGANVATHDMAAWLAAVDEAPTEAISTNRPPLVTATAAPSPLSTSLPSQLPSPLPWPIGCRVDDTIVDPTANPSASPLAVPLADPLANPATAASTERQFGIAVHAYLEATAPADRPAFPSLTVAVTEEAATAARRILQTPALARFFDPQAYLRAKNEVALSLTQEGQPTMRRIDRLVEFTDEVWVLDYKTGQPSPHDHEQLKTYCQAVAVLYPAKRICGALINAAGEMIGTISGVGDG